MPDEVAVADAPIVAAEAPAADPAEGTAPPTPVEGEQPTPEGDAAPGAEGGQQDYSAVEAELEAEVERRLADRADQLAESTAERVKQRTKEADDGESSRMQLYATAESEARANATTLRQLAQTGELDEVTLTQHMNPIIAGVQALAARDNEAVVKAIVDAGLPEPTDAETAAIEPLLYEFRRNGRLDTLPAKVMDLALARKDTEIADLKAQLGNRKSTLAMAEKLANLHEQVGNGVGSETPAGAAAKRSKWAEIQKMNQAQLDALPPGEWERAMNEG